MKHRKIVALIFAITLGLTALTACTKQSDEKETGSTVAQSSAVKNTKAAAKTTKSPTAAKIKKDPITAPKKKAAVTKTQMKDQHPTAARTRKIQKSPIAAQNK